mmetsp:Transcript_29163/g.95149  ORF Transcript_29163/g.95149 Transcript_29163/m.95149 type:complete len:247 (+) Transcript_29163:57-797(+)
MPLSPPTRTVNVCAERHGVEQLPVDLHLLLAPLGIPEQPHGASHHVGRHHLELLLCSLLARHSEHELGPLQRGPDGSLLHADHHLLAGALRRRAVAAAHQPAACAPRARSHADALAVRAAGRRRAHAARAQAGGRLRDALVQAARERVGHAHAPHAQHTRALAGQHALARGHAARARAAAAGRVERQHVAEEGQVGPANRPLGVLVVGLPGRRGARPTRVVPAPALRRGRGLGLGLGGEHPAVGAR